METGFDNSVCPPSHCFGFQIDPKGGVCHSGAAVAKAGRVTSTLLLLMVVLSAVTAELTPAPWIPLVGKPAFTNGE